MADQHSGAALPSGSFCQHLGDTTVRRRKGIGFGFAGVAGRDAAGIWGLIGVAAVLPGAAILVTGRSRPQ